MSAAYPPLAITGYWSRLNDSIIDLVDYIPDDKLSWSPAPELFNVRGILIHLAVARTNWLENVVKDGLFVTDGPVLSESSEPIEVRLRRLLQHGKTKGDLKDNLRWSWERVTRFVADPAKLAAEYWIEFDGVNKSGHWVAFHLLEHDVHHRADLFQYLHILGIEHPDVGTP